ncbi:Metal-sensitive transcriptional repressor [compost metagenome]
MHRLRRAEGQVRGLQKLLEEGADCAKIAQQLLATRHALDSTFVRLNLSLAEQELAAGAGSSSQAVSEVLDRLQHKLGRAR